jgi:NADH dehydrogenase
MRVRVLTRDRNRAKHLPEAVEIVEGNVRDPETLTPAMVGVMSVISAIQGLDDPKSDPMATDRDGNRNLITAAKASGADHFVLVSVVKASPDHPMSLGRAKYAAEQFLKASGLAWTIVRGTAYMEFWATLVGQPLIDKGRTQVFGRGDNPINFVSVNDVAKAVEMAVVDSGMRGVDLEVGGPENFTMNQVVESFERMTGRKGKVSHVPLTMMRIMSVVIRPVKPAMARIVQAGVVMDTSDIMAWEPPADRTIYPWLLYTPLAEVIKTTENTPA